MSRHLKVFAGILVVGTLLIVGFRFFQPILRDSLQRNTSDAAGTKGIIRLGMDNWIGYFPLCSPKMERNLRQIGYLLRCEDDQADYAARFKRLKQGELQFAVATVDAYLLNGADTGYPATIAAVIDESKGGDAIVARKAVFPDLDALKKNPDTRIAFTPASPSEHLLKAVSTHFDLPFFSAGSKQWRIETNGSIEALKRLQNGKVDAAVLWEPDVSRALTDPAVTKLIGTEDTDKLIVDILLVERRYSDERPEAVSSLLKAYFKTLHDYYQHPHELRRDIIARDNLDEPQVESMLDGVDWTSLSENGGLWYGITPHGRNQNDGLIDAIQAALDILIANRDFKSNPLPGEDPYRLTNSKFIAQLFTDDTASINQGRPAAADTLKRRFSPLDDPGWSGLKRVGTLKVEPVSFRRGSAMLDYAGKQTLDNVAEKLRRYPNFRILIEGHTGVRGDKQANLDLSLARAEAVTRYLDVTYQVDDNRARALGYGGSRPLPRMQGEPRRAYAYRLPRVEISLVTEAY